MTSAGDPFSAVVSLSAKERYMAAHLAPKAQADDIRPVIPLIRKQRGMMGGIHIQKKSEMTARMAKAALASINASMVFWSVARRENEGRLERVSFHEVKTTFIDLGSRPFSVVSLIAWIVFVARVKRSRGGGKPRWQYVRLVVGKSSQIPGRQNLCQKDMFVALDY